MNIVRAMVKDPDDTIVLLGWIRLQHQMALRDPNWEMESSLQEAKPDAYIGSVECLQEMSEGRSSEVRLGMRS